MLLLFLVVCSSKECVCVVPVIPVCVWMLLPYMLFMFLYVDNYHLIKSFSAGSHVVALCVLHTMWSGKSLQLLYTLPFGMLCLSAISMFVKIMLSVCMLV